MSLRDRAWASVASVVLVTACSSDTATPPGTGTGGVSSGGAANGGSAGASAGGSTSGGTNGAGTGTGGSSLGGTATGGASAGTGAAPSGAGGMPGGTGAGGNAGSSGSGMAGAGTAGAGASGAGGMSGAAGSTAGGAGGSGGSAGAMPSPGCGKSSGTPMNVNVPNAIVTFPDGYNGSTPVPMLFGFHGAGRTNQDFYMTDARMQNSDLEEHFAMVYLKSAGSAWAASDSSRLDTAFNQMTQDHCIDLKRVFATGHSSGAQFIERRLCDGETRFAAVAPVAGSRTCNSWAALPALLIHGLNDNQRAGDESGQQERGPFITSNSCSMTTMPYTSAMACNSISNQAAVNNGCVAHEGCEKPFVFCNHNDQNYSGTNHGWPCFANQTMYAFFTSI